MISALLVGWLFITNPQGTLAAEEQPWQFSATLLSLEPAPRYSVQSTLDWVTWTEESIIPEGTVIILDCEQHSQKFWRIVPLAEP